MLHQQSAPLIFISAGEPSGDLHGANLIRSIRQQDATYGFVGFGGPRMSAAGAELLADLTRFSIMWFFRVLVHLHHFYGLLRKADRYFRDHRPVAVVLIDYPGFHWWLARRAKAHGIPVFYYGTPQMWAWAPWRIHKMRRLVDHVLCKLPFEADWYSERGCPATYVGHPYFDELATRTLDANLVTELKGKGSSPLIGILPGSRVQEIETNLPQFLRTALLVSQQLPAAKFVIASFNEEQAELARRLCQRVPVKVSILAGRTPEVIEAARCCLACSGSVSLELLYHEKPTVIHYGVHYVAYQAQNFFRTARFITLVNLLATSKITRSRYDRPYDPDDVHSERVPFPEYLTYRDRSAGMARWIVRWSRDNVEFDHLVGQLRDLKRRFAQPGASDHAASYILKSLAVPPPSTTARKPHWSHPTTRSSQHADR